MIRRARGKIGTGKLTLRESKVVALLEKYNHVGGKRKRSDDSSTNLQPAKRRKISGESNLESENEGMFESEMDEDVKEFMKKESPRKERWEMIERST